jgi:hypothetical protein
MIASTPIFAGYISFVEVQKDGANGVDELGGG